MVSWYVDNEDGYRDWLAANPDGFVLNTTRVPSAPYLILHRSSCRTINRPADQRAWTHDYGKACANTRSAIEAWARVTTGGVSECRLCLG